jgi:hypothetical protein
MWSAPEPLDPSTASPIPPALVAALPTATTLMSGVPGATADAARAHAALQATLVALARSRRPVTGDAQEVDRWEGEGGPVGPLPSREGAERVIRARAQRASAGHEIARRDVAEQVRAYTRVLRGAGVPLALTLTAVSAIVRDDAAAILSPATYAAVQRDAVRSALEAYFGP